MPRKPVIRSNEHYYHLTGRSNNKEHFYLPADDVWEIMLKRLRLLQVEYDLKISAFVLMGNHFHLLALTPREPIDRIMFFFMKDVTRDLQKRTGRINKIFGGRYKGCLIADSRYLLNVYKYIYRNPVAAGLVDRVEDYTYSSLNRSELPIVLDKVMPVNMAVSSIAEMQWLNTSFEKNEAESVRWGLSKNEFHYRKERIFRRPIGPNLGL